MTRVLVTGATGFIGSHLVNRLKDRFEVVALVRDYVPSRWLEDALEGCVRVRGDVRDYELLKRVMVRYEVERVVHLAAVAIVKHAVKHPVETFDVNVMGTVKLLEASREAGVERVVVLSTDKVFGEGLDKRVFDPYTPEEVYGCSKACADLLARTWNKVYGKPEVVVARSCNVYGYDPFNPRIVSNTVKSCLKGVPPVIFKGWSGRRQYVYVEDLVSALTHLTVSELPLMVREIRAVNVATGDFLSQEEVVSKILKFFPGLKPRYVEKPGYREVKDQSMVPSEFGWKPRYTFEEGIRETIEKFKRYRGDWDK